MAGGQQVIETALWGLSLLITAAVCFWIGVGVGRGDSVPRDRIMEICDTCPGRGDSVPRGRIMEICDTCPGRREKYKR